MHLVSSCLTCSGMPNLSMFSNEKREMRKYMKSLVKLWYLDFFCKQPGGLLAGEFGFVNYVSVFALYLFPLEFLAKANYLLLSLSFDVFVEYRFSKILSEF